MGRSNTVLMPWYKSIIEQSGETALLGFTDNNWFNGDLYDLSLENWNINSDWELTKKYDTIICLRCAYFAKDPQTLIKKCYDHLKKNGRLYIDWGLGDHWRYENYKIGWVKDGEHESYYKEDNYLWSTVWDDSFVENLDYKVFEKRVEKFGYDNVEQSIKDEVPEILDINYIKKYFDLSYNMISLWEDLPQLYIMVSGKKNEG